jgi:class 3 adenylate cyclase/tetratricopeptide (TPR) repeat protein
MRCSRCQHENSPRANFCEECGTPLVRTCASCGSPITPTAKFCPECAHPVSAVTETLPRPASPDAYTPRHLAERILISRSALAGERKQVTVLFADLKSSMELLADRDPEEARELLDPVLQRMMDAVHQYEGTVNQVMGDGIMALFGAPLAHEDHAVRACYAALAMQAAMRRYTEEARRAHGIEVQIRVGLNSGEVVVRAIGSDLHMDYTAIGQTTHLAARMEQLATPGTIRLTADTLHLAEGFVEVKPLGPIPVRGLDTPIEVYELIGADPSRSRLQAAAARGLTRFVGRERELEELGEALGRAGEGSGQVVAIVGEPGVGKSRLFREFVHSHRTDGWLVLESSSASFGKATPYLPVIDLLKAYCQIELRDDGRKIKEKVTGKLLTLDRALERSLPALFALLAVPVEDPAWERLDPRERRQRTREALKRLVLRESQVQPVLVAMEDLHWIDAETQGFLDSLIDSLPTARILLLVNYRPEYQHGWGSRTYYTQLRVDPLLPESAAELLRSLLGEDAGLEPLTERLISQTQGNPFFLEESVRTLVETQALVGERGAYRLAKLPPSPQVPATVQAVLAARIDRLPPEEKRLLEAAAVIGEEVPFPLLRAIADEAEETLHRGLAHLRAAEFLYEARLFPDVEYTFKHGLTHQVAYAGLLHERRRALHARIVEALERLYPDRLAEHAARLAHHAVHGEMWEKAVGYLQQAASQAAGRAANQDAVAYLEQALGALARLPADRPWAEVGVDIRLDLRSSLGQLGRHGQIAEHLREAERLAAAIGDQQRLGRVYALVSDRFRLQGDRKRALEVGEQALAIARTLADGPLEVTANTFLGMVHQAGGAYREAIALFDRNVAVLAGAVGPARYEIMEDPSVHSRSWLCACSAEVGDFARGEAAGAEAMRIAEGSGRPLNLVCACAGLGRLFLRKGADAQAVAVLDRGFQLSRRLSLDVWTLVLASALALGCARVGRAADALAFAELGLEPESADANLSNQPLRLGWLAEAYLLAGQLETARRMGERALELARRHDQQGHLAWALFLAGELAPTEGGGASKGAEGHYREAMTTAEALGMRPLVARAHLGLGWLLRSSGELSESADHLLAASTLFAELGMTAWQQRCDSERR